MLAEQALSIEREARALGIPRGGALPAVSLLSFSGGGDDGAFGSGLLVGWTAHGDRPQFKLVTGVSAGALIAPFAFLGTAYDATLAKVYTDIEPSEVFVARPVVLAALTEDALSDTGPLYKTISNYITEDILAAIAAEYHKGRLLLIQTTDLDAGRPVIWNIGAIAASGNPRALDLLRHIMLASASIPAAFPPVMFDVEAKGQAFSGVACRRRRGQPSLSHSAQRQHRGGPEGFGLYEKGARLRLYYSQFAVDHRMERCRKEASAHRGQSRHHHDQL